MDAQRLEALLRAPLFAAMAREEEVFWLNPELEPAAEALEDPELSAADVADAAARLRRFAPVLFRYFPETAPAGGLIESPLTEIPQMQAALGARDTRIPGRLFLKRDSDLAVAGSVKARGGVYEVLAHAEALAFAAGLLNGPADDYLKLTSPAARAFFSGRKLQVGSTGNLGLSIGISGAALGFDTVVHMSADAKQWKKDLLRAKGATVIEYAGDYGEAVRRGRAQSAADPRSYFVDDENSRALFCGYAVAGERLKRQLTAANVAVDAAHPLFVYLPCGVGGAPGGIAFGLKLAFGDAVHCFFAEPTGAPCMLLGMASGLFHNIAVQDLGLSGKTAADGLAVGRCSSFAGAAVRGLISGEGTVKDGRLTEDLRLLYHTEHFFIEPSACAGFGPLRQLHATAAGKAYLEDVFTVAGPENATHIVWATGGSLVPPAVRAAMLGEE